MALCPYWVDLWLYYQCQVNAEYTQYGALTCTSWLNASEPFREWKIGKSERRQRQGCRGVALTLSVNTWCSVTFAWLPLCRAKEKIHSTGCLGWVKLQCHLDKSAWETTASLWLIHHPGCSLQHSRCNRTQCSLSNDIVRDAWVWFMFMRVRRCVTDIQVNTLLERNWGRCAKKQVWYCCCWCFRQTPKQFAFLCDE